VGSGTIPLKIVVIDDDPTGSQTVHGCPLLLSWRAETLAAALAHPSPLLFLLANTRALDPAAASARVREICRALRPALEAARAAGAIDRWLLVSRGDSTLRSHFPIEAETIAAELGPFDATLLVPAFLEGGRTTVDGVHLLHGRPVHESAFARDRLFGFRSSYLPAWVEERSGGRIAAAAVARIGWAELEAAAAGAAGRRRLRDRLAAFGGNRIVAIDAERPAHLATLADLVRELARPGEAPGGRPRRFLFQSAAGVLPHLAGLPPARRDAAALAGLRRRGPGGDRLPGLVVVGSHVPLADAQLEALLREPACAAVELPVERVRQALAAAAPPPCLADLEAALGERLERRLAQGRTPVLFTSRGEADCRDPGERRALGRALAGLTARLAAARAARLGYLLSKGGITSHTLLAEGLGAERVDLQGQLLPGLSLVLVVPPAAPGAAGLPVLTMPGNLGDATTLRTAWRWMEDPERAAAAQPLPRALSSSS
jgi:uncharacterized protein YgbK (DUF1537 family)